MPRHPHWGRNVAIVGGVVALHGAALWALNQGLLRPALEAVVPAQILVELVSAPPPPAAPVAAAPTPPAPAKQPVAREPATAKPRPAPKPRPMPTPAPQPLAVQDSPTPAPAVSSSPPAPTPLAATALSPAPPTSSGHAAPGPATPANPVVVAPSTQAAYLNNPKPPYPAISRRLGEAGRVMVRVHVGLDGRATEARIQRSSGYDRLDQLALETARDRWRYVPGTRNGVPEAAWLNVPINFSLESD